jgi:hypothetical protein
MTPRAMNHQRLYPCGDRARPGVMAVSTGQERPPKQGEWYLSGGPPRAWLAPNDLSTPYYIARLVKVERVVQYRIIERLDNRGRPLA